MLAPNQNQLQRKKFSNNTMMDMNAKFVDLAALSLSGSLVPSVPTQIMLKFNPPKMTIVYHFE